MPRGAAVIKLNPNRRQSYDRERLIEVKIGDAQVAMLKKLVDYEGLKGIADAIGISQMTVLRVCGGWFDRCSVNSQKAIRAFFAEQR